MIVLCLAFVASPVVVFPRAELAAYTQLAGNSPYLR